MEMGWRGQYLRYKDFFLNILAVYKQKKGLKVYLELILSLTMITIFSVFALRPTVLTIIDLTKEIKGKEATLLQLNEKIKGLGLARNVFNKEQRRISIIDSAIPRQPAPEKFIRQLEGLSSDGSVSILSASTGEITLIGTQETNKKSSDAKPPPLSESEIPVSVNIAGNYQNLYAFIAKIENLRRPFKVDTLGINSSETPEGKIIITTISGEIPYLKQNNEEK